MVSYQLTKEALSRYLNGLPASQQTSGTVEESGGDAKIEVLSFNQVLSSVSVKSPEEKGITTRQYHLYICLCKDRIMFINTEALYSEDGMMIPPLPEALAPARYDKIKSVVVDANVETKFTLLFKEDTSRPNIIFNCVYRKSLLEELQILYNTYSIIQTNTVTPLQIRFEPEESDPNAAYRHPSQKLLEMLVPTALQQNKAVFYRRGYMFFLDRDAFDRYELLDNRPTSTYYLPSSNDTEEDAKGAPGKTNQKSKAAMQAKLRQMTVTDFAVSEHLVVRFMPEKSISSESRDSELAFHLWTESIAAAIAKREYEYGSGKDAKDEVEEAKFVDSYFIPERGVYRKKMNVVNDQAQWSCYKVLVYCQKREIAVIGCRRRYIPPLCDTYQDMVFVLFGHTDSPTLFNIKEAALMKKLEQIIDSLSPAVCPTTADVALKAIIEPNEIKSIALSKFHPTYLDTRVMQARADALLYNKDAFAWLRNRLNPSIFPRTKAKDMECDRLARKFCISLLHLFANSSKQQLSNQQNDKPVDNPLSLILRMQSETDVKNSSDLDLADWKRRISRYFAYAVDGGQLPGVLSISMLAKAKPHAAASDFSPQEFAVDDYVSDENMPTIHKVLAHLLYISRPGKPYFEADTIREQLAYWLDERGQLPNDLTFNEWVMVRLLESSYFTKSHLLTTGNRDVYVLLLKVLLTRDDNLELLRAVTNTITETAREHNFSELIDPLYRLVKTGDTFVKADCMRTLVAFACHTQKTDVNDYRGSEPDDDGKVLLGDVQLSPSQAALIRTDLVLVAINLVRDTKNTDLLINSLAFLTAVFDIIDRLYRVDKEFRKLRAPLLPEDKNPFYDDPKLPLSLCYTLAMIIQPRMSTFRGAHKKALSRVRFDPPVLRYALSLITKIGIKNDECMAAFVANPHSIGDSLVQIVEDRSDCMDVQLHALEAMYVLFGFRVVQQVSPSKRFVSLPVLTPENGKKMLEALRDFHAQNKLDLCYRVMRILQRVLARRDIPDKDAQLVELSDQEQKNRMSLFRELIKAILPSTIAGVTELLQSQVDAKGQSDHDHKDATDDSKDREYALFNNVQVLLEWFNFNFRFVKKHGIAKFDEVGLLDQEFLSWKTTTKKSRTKNQVKANKPVSRKKT